MATDAAKRPWEETGEDKRTYVRRMFAQISPRYDLLNSLMSLRLHHRWRADAVRGLSLKAGDNAIDLCCGTGDFALPLRQAVGAGGRVAGFDFCVPMLEKAKDKIIRAAFASGDACRLPLRDGVANGVTVGWGLRNVPDIAVALEEIYRILKPGGRFASVDMSVPKSAALRAMNGAVFHRIVPALGGLFGNREAYTYLPESTELFAAPESLAKMMKDIGFRDVRFRRRFFGNIATHWGTK